LVHVLLFLSVQKLQNVATTVKSAFIATIPGNIPQRRVSAGSEYAAGNPLQIGGDLADRGTPLLFGAG
jgi:hypothetical protein